MTAAGTPAADRTEQPATAWHPPRRLLEVIELVLAGALGQVPAGLDLPPDIEAALADGGVLLQDAEGTPVAVLAGDGVHPRQPFSAPPLRAHRRSPEQVRQALTDLAPAGAPVTAVPVSGSLSQSQVTAVVEHAASGRVLWLVLVGAGRQQDLPPPALLHAVRDLAVAAPVPGIAVPVALPVFGGGGLPELDDVALLAEVATAMGAQQVVQPPPAGPGEAPHPAFADTLEAAARRRGVTVLFTGLSGSGKSTVAKGLADRIESQDERTVSLLDGDEVRRLLSAGLGFSRADRDLNIRRIGYVATEVTRHGGMAICAPIAPFAQVREQVRAAVEEAGDFVLVHVSTPLAECERRDRKGLYARARQGLIPDFTGISSPYEAPDDADLVLDTSAISVPDAVEAVHRVLRERGHLTRTGSRGAVGDPA